MVKNHINDREDFKEYVKNFGGLESCDYKIGSSAFKYISEIVKDETGFDYYSEENKKLDFDKRWEEFQKAEGKVDSKRSRAMFELAKEVYKELYGTDKVSEMSSKNLNSSEFKDKLADKLKHDARSARRYDDKVVKDSYLLDKVHAMSRNMGLLAKLLRFDAVCHTPPQSARGNNNFNNLTSGNMPGGADDEMLLYSKKNLNHTEIESENKLKDYYDFVGDEVVLVNFDDLIMCAEKV